MNKIFKSQKRVKKYNANRFTACLLAALMLFSALSTGSITVHAETPGAVAQIGETTYTSLAGAIAAAEAIATSENAVEIKMLANITLEADITIGDFISLNLNGYDLYVQLRSANGKLSELCRIESNVLKQIDASENKINLMSLNTGEYKIKIICDFKTKTRDIYVNGAQVENGINVTMRNQSTFNSEQVNDLLRFSIPANTTTSDVCVDDIFIYEVVLPSATE